MKKALKIFRNYSFYLIILTVLLLRFFVFMPVVVEGTSMVPTLENSEKGVSFKRYTQPKRFDIVIINNNDKLLVKRVIGLPGENIKYVNSELYINDVFVKESFNPIGTTENFEYSLGVDEYFCIGDNREHSMDSRVYGPFNIDQIIAKGFIPIMK